MITNSDTSKHPPKKFANGNVWRRLNTELLWFIAASYNGVSSYIYANLIVRDIFHILSYWNINQGWYI